MAKIIHKIVGLVLTMDYKVTIILGMTNTTTATRLMTAKYSGVCRSCKEWISVGDQIEYSRETGAHHATCPAKAERVIKAAPEKLVPGVYEANNEVYVVKFNREKTNLYAKRLVVQNANRATEAGERVGIEFEYDRGAIFSIKLADRMPVERAKELITLYGHCIACGRFLKAAKSVENGIGPVCIKNFGPVLEVVSETVDGRRIRRAA